MANLEAILKERGSNYGDFRSQAELARTLKKVVHAHAELNGVELTPYQEEGLDMILYKISRIANGNPHHVDSWEDISGYAEIVKVRVIQDLENRTRPAL